MKVPVRVLLVEDNPGDSRYLREIIKEGPLNNFTVQVALSLAETEQQLREQEFDLILLDLNLPDSAGLETVDRACQSAPRIPIVVLTGADDEILGMEAVRRGAQDYLVKGQVDGRSLSRAAGYAIERNRVQEELRSLNEHLEQRVAERTRLAEQRSDQLRLLASELIEAEQRERRRLSQILRDNLEQFLLAAKFSLSVLRNRGDDRDTRRVVQQIDDILDEAIRASRSLTQELSPPVLYDAELDAALIWLAQWMEEKHGLRVEIDVKAATEHIEENVRILLFQAARELLFNVLKHAHINKAQVRLVKSDQNHLLLSVADAGTGFETSQIRATGKHVSGFGLFNIRERFELLNGKLDIESAPGKGTRVTILIPIG